MHVCTTVSRCGIIYVSEEELDWWPVTQAWINTRGLPYKKILTSLFVHYVGECTKIDPGHLFEFISRNCEPVMESCRVGIMTGCFRLLAGLLDESTLTEPKDPSDDTPTPEMAMQ